MDLLNAESNATTGAVIEIRDVDRELLSTVPVDLAAEPGAGNR